MDTLSTLTKPTRRPGRLGPAGTPRALAALAISLLALGMLSCGGRSSLSIPEGPAAPPAAEAPATPAKPAGAPGGMDLPAPASLRGLSTMQGGRLATGGSALPELRGGTLEFGTNNVNLAPNWDGAANFEPAWVGFAFDMTGYSGLAEIRNSMEYASAGAKPVTYYGLANWELDRWQWFEAEANAALAFDSLAPFTRAGDNRLVVIILLLDTATGSLDWVRAGDNVPGHLEVAAAPLSGLAPLEVTFDGTACYDHDSGEEYLYDFEGTGHFVPANGDTDANALHTYTTAGTFNGVARMVEAEGVYVDQPFTVTVSGYRPLPVISADKHIGQPGEMVNFSAAGSSDPDGGIVSYAWDVDGDGSDDSGGPGVTTASMQFMQAGTFRPRLTVTDNQGNTASEYVTIVIGAPIHETEPNETAEAADELPTTPFQSWLGDIGPAAPSGAGDVDWARLHVTKPGTYTFNLLWADNASNLYLALFERHEQMIGGVAAGDKSFTCTLAPGDYWVRIINGTPALTTQYSLTVTSLFTALPVAVPLVDPASGDYPLAVTLKGNGSYDPDGTVVKYEWDAYGDGHFETDAGSSPQTSFTYKRRGTFHARLRVTDDSGAQAVSTCTVVVDGPPLDEVEPNGYNGAPQPLSMPVAGFRGDRGTPGDVAPDDSDEFLLSLPASGTLELSLAYDTGTARLAVWLYKDGAPNFLKVSTTAMDGSETLEWALAEAGTYRVLIGREAGASEYVLNAQVN